MTNEESQEAKLARVDTQLIGIKDSLVKIEAKLDVWGNTYVPRAEINEMFRARDKEIQEIKDSKKDARTNVVAWAAVVVGIISIIVALSSNT